MQVRFHRLSHSEYQILQVSNPDKELLEKTLNEKYPTVIVNTVSNWHMTEIIDKIDIETTKSAKFKKMMNGYTNFYNMPLTITSDNIISHYDAGDTQYITKQVKSRYFLIQIKGNSKVILFAPKEEQYLYSTNSNISKVNFWKLEMLGNQNQTEEKQKYLDKFPKFNQAKYIEILLSEGHMLFVPYNWWYTVLSIDNNVRIISTSSSLFAW